MDTSQIAVTITGVFLVGIIAWFFLTPHSTAAQPAAIVDGVQEQVIVVKGGYSPDTIQVKAGTPVRLVFDRQENIMCSSEIVIPDFGINRRLKAFDKTIIEITPDKPGTYSFACGMNMLHGTIVVE